MNDLTQSWMSVRDASGTELTARIEVPYQGDPGTPIVLQVIASGVPVDMALYDSPVEGLLLRVIERTNPFKRALTAGEIYPLTFVMP